MDTNDLWNQEIATSYDTPGEGMFSSEVLGPTVKKLKDLAQKGPVLEFAIGTGRVAVPLSHEGVSVSGIELSPAMIGQLRKKADEDTIPVVMGDMAKAKFPGKFSLVYLVFNTISNLLTQKEQVECFKNAARHLLPKGRFVIELWVPELHKLSPEHNSYVWRSDPDYIGLDTYDMLNQTLVSSHFKISGDNKTRLFRSPHRYIWPSELDLMAQLAGFKLENRYSDWIDSPFTAESPTHVSVYQKP